MVCSSLFLSLLYKENTKENERKCKFYNFPALQKLNRFSDAIKWKLLEQFIRYGFQAKDIYKKFPGFRLNSLKKPTDKISYLCTKYWNKNYLTLRKQWLKEGIDYYLKRGM